MLTVNVRTLAEELGMTVVGVAGVDRFEGAPRGHRPADLLPGARSVISLGVRIPGRLLAWSELMQNSEALISNRLAGEMGRHVYGRCGYDVINNLLEGAALRLVLQLEGEGYESIYLPATFGDSSRLIERVGFFGPFSHRHAAVRAGLGEFGYNGLVLTPRYGPRMRFISAITTAELAPDPLLEEPVCLREECRVCLRECPGQAFELDDDYVLDGGPFLNSPSTIDSPYCQQTQKNAGCTGCCIRVCPAGSDVRV